MIKAADDFANINARLRELEAQPAEKPEPTYEVHYDSGWRPAPIMPGGVTYVGPGVVYGASSSTDVAGDASAGADAGADC